MEDVLEGIREKMPGIAVRRLEAAVGFILNPRDEVLIQFKDDGYPWETMAGFYGGAIEQGESPTEAFEREVIEEMGSNLISRPIYLFKHPLVDLRKDRSAIRVGNLHVHYARFNGSPADIKVKEGAGFAFVSERNLDRFPIVSHNKSAMRQAYQLMREGKVQYDDSRI